MNEDKITPAIHSHDDLPNNEMSAAEFQRRLYSWFEDRGLLSQLRAHLRSQMVGVLKEKGVGRIVSSSKISPKLQALNLLIAEFLLQQDYHYSLSVFSAEVPLTNVLPEFPNYTFNVGNSVKQWQFSDKDMWDIIETLGIPRYTEEAQNIFNVYYNGTNNDSLLTCIIKMLHSLQNTVVRNADTKQLTKSTPGNWRKNVHELLTNHNVNTQNANRILKIFSEVIEHEQARLRSETREEYLKLEHELQLQFQTIMKVHEEKVTELQCALSHELSKSEEMAKNYERQQIQHRDRLHKLIVREQNVSKRESQIAEKDAFVKAQEFLIKTRFDALQKEQSSLSVLQGKLEYEMSQSKNVAKIDAKLLKDLEAECHNLKGQAVNNTREVPQKENEQEKAQLLMEQLKNENDSLKAMNTEQQILIRELSQRATLLIRELEDTQHAFNNLQASGQGVITVPPLTLPGLVGRVIVGGAGEEGLRHTQRIRCQNSFSNTPEAIRRRSTAHKLILHSPSSSDDYSPTNELLREARERLKRLEQESEDIDRNYRLYQSTLNNNFKAFNASLTVPNIMVPSYNFNTCDGVKLFNIAMANEQINEDKPESREPKQSEASSDVWDGAGTSGISFSAVPTSDERSDSHEEDNAS